MVADRGSKSSILARHASLKKHSLTEQGVTLSSFVFIRMHVIFSGSQTERLFGGYLQAVQAESTASSSFTSHRTQALFSQPALINSSPERPRWQ